MEKGTERWGACDTGRIVLKPGQVLSHRLVILYAALRRRAQSTVSVSIPIRASRPIIRAPPSYDIAPVPADRLFDTITTAHLLSDHLISHFDPPSSFVFDKRKEIWKMSALPHQ